MHLYNFDFYRTECYEKLFKIAVEMKKIEPDAELCLRH